MLAIQPGGLDCGDEELGAIGVFACIGHAHPSRPVVLQLEVLVWEALTIDALSWGETEQGREVG